MKRNKKTITLNFFDDEYNTLVKNAIKSKIGSYGKDLVFKPNITEFIKSKIL